jgi:hypothetical protein
MQGSQMYTPGPATSLRTCRCSRPQNEHSRWAVGSWRRRRRHRRTPPSSMIWWIRWWLMPRDSATSRIEAPARCRRRTARRYSALAPSSWSSSSVTRPAAAEASVNRFSSTDICLCYVDKVPDGARREFDGRTQPTYLLRTETVGAVALELPGISPDADALNVNANEFDPVIPPHATIWPVIDGELA